MSELIACPVCGTGNFGSSINYNCRNGCFSVFDFGGIYQMTVFDEKFPIPISNEEEGTKIWKLCMERINYWKENDKYLAQFITR